MACETETVTETETEYSSAPSNAYKRTRPRAIKIDYVEMPSQEGAAFRPKDHALVDHFLRHKIAGEPVDARFIHDADVYWAAPDELVGMHTPAPGTATRPVWYFFSPLYYLRGGRTSRMVGVDAMGFWRMDSHREPVKGSAAGYLQHFHYTVNASAKNSKPEWLMVEYGIPQEDGGREQVVLCKVYRSPRAPR